MTRIWHYTIGFYIKPIFVSKCILPATAYVSKKEQPVVWFSSNDVWEETANKSAMINGKVVHFNRIETAKHCGGLIRIEVDPKVASYNWEQFKKISGIDSKSAKSLEVAALKNGANPKDWWVSFSPVSIDSFLDVEFYSNNKWISMSTLVNN